MAIPTTSPGSYKGTQIKPGTDAEIQAQIKNIDALAGAGTREQNIPGVGKIKITSKNPVATPAAAPVDDMSGVYERLGMTPPAPAKNYGTAPAIPGMPSYPNKSASTAASESILKTYDTYMANIGELEKRLTQSATPSAEERQAQEDLIAAKAALGNFDRSTLERIESFSGQGRGATLPTIALREDKERRTSALERLGLAQEVDTLSETLGMRKEERLALGDIAETQYNLASKRLDVALGIQDKLKSLSDDERDNARQYLLDVVAFGAGKTFEQFDPATQSAIKDAVANSPITLDMVRTSLSSAAEKDAMAKRGELRSVPGVGVVQIKPDGSGYKVIVPEVASSGSLPGYKFTQGQRSQFLAAGFAAEAINAFQQDVAEYGIDSAVSGFSPEKQKAARRILAGSDSTNDALTPDTQFLSPEYFQTLFTDAQLKESADAAGFRHWFNAWSTEKQNYLGHLMNIVEQYRKAGMSDTDILKQMQ